MPATAPNLKPAPRCCCVLGTEVHTTLIGAGHRAVVLGATLHEGLEEQLMLAPSHALRLARQLIAAARECGEDVALAVLEAEACQVRPAPHPYEKTLPQIEYGAAVDDRKPWRRTGAADVIPM